MFKFLIKTISTFFYVGYFPFIPGTAGSVAAVFLFFLVKNNPSVYFITALILLALGFLVSGRAEKLLRRHDPPCIVIDEVGGMLVSLLFLPYDIRLVVIAFVIFRILDTLKPYPISSFEKLKGGLGVMSDDIIAGLYTNLILQVVVSFTSFSAA
ncbi:MAG: phosphatidylglycerophosphatase A [Candidatus Omnitrophica bacterium]|nr:phosphatidylglycerophosphatase A [Candidatus Omnitrophota bacterium]MDD5026866.1 phosphatidylglycerophosphatase A [Candidatus Omnitrophota bacterium]MDD5661993.1 phosphatidylglycerophosphatase A [Candidatus Omnitrophota bacterium]